jgi:hypothetical protein
MREVLSFEVDKHGNDLSILHDVNLAGSDAYWFFIKHYAELIESGHATPRCNWIDSECGILYAVADNKIVGSIAYQESEDSLLLLLSSVDKEHRKNGIFTVLNKYFEQLAKDKGKTFIFSTVSVDNTVRLESAKRTNFNPVALIMTKIL